LSRTQQRWSNTFTERKYNLVGNKGLILRAKFQLEGVQTAGPVTAIFLQSSLRRLSVPQEENPQEPERIPFFQRLLENPFLLLFLGVVVPTVFYILWGIMEIATIPVAQ